jgi:hypothetical protein
MSWARTPISCTARKPDDGTIREVLLALPQLREDTFAAGHQGFFRKTLRI